MTYHIDADRCAELVVNGIISWSGPRADVLCEPANGCRLVVAQGNGNAEHSFAMAKELRLRLREAIAKTLTEFSAEMSAENQARAA